MLSNYGCSEKNSTKNTSQAYITEIEKWQQKRVESLKSEESWLNLAGLFWLKDGENSFGSNSENDIVFPGQKAPDFIGSFILKDSTVTVRIRDKVNVLHDGQSVRSLQLTQTNSDTPILSFGSLRWFIIQRGDRFAVRLRDLESKTLAEFTGIESYPIDANWRIQADFKQYETPELIPIPNILGTVHDQASPGVLIFKIDGKELRLHPLGEITDDELWIIFSDGTTGKSTYGGGRYLYMDTPKDGKGIIDFNKAYNPPCVFTNFATCPLPPESNKITVKVLAGEKYYYNGLH